jgi:protein disulfide-isomerase
MYEQILDLFVNICKIMYMTLNPDYKMLNKLLFVFGAVLCVSSCRLVAEQAGKQSTIKWQTNYEQVIQSLQQSKSASPSKPILLFFTGSDWCGWCNKLDDEAFETPEFAAAAGNQFTFVKLDFPLYSNQDSQIKAQNKKLQEQFNVRSFPTVILVDPKVLLANPKTNQTIGVTGYRPGGGKSFADHLIKMYKDYSGYKQKMSSLDTSKHSGALLKQMYEKAKDLNLAEDTARIVKKGMQSNESLYFMGERYRHLAEEGQIHSKEATDLKQQLLNSDPLNEKQIHYQIALIDFETYSNEMEKEHHAPELTVAPFISYIEKFGAKDKENLWRLQLLISQVYLDNNEMTSALNYAQLSYEAAPPCVQPELSRAIQSIRSQIHSSR